MRPAEQIIDILLEELLSDESPPDVRAAILDRSRQDHAPRASRVIRGGRRRRTASRIGPRWKTAATVAAAVALVAGAAWFYGRDRIPEQVRSEKRPSPRSTRQSAAPKATRHAPDAQAPLPDVDVPFASQAHDTTSARSAPTGSLDPVRPVIEPWDDARIVAAIEENLADEWKGQGIEPSPAADDSIWCRRLYVRLIGRIPQVSELQAFLRWPADRRRAMLIERLTASDDYRSEWTEHWALFWTNLSIGRRGGLNGGRADREGMLAYWRSAVAENRPWNVVVEEVLSAEGTSRPDSSDFNGAVNFWLVHSTPNAVRMTSQAARLFWGQRIDCLRCHDDPRGHGKQEDYWKLNPLFRLVRAEHAGEGVFRLRSQMPSSIREGVYFERPDGRLALAIPRFPDGRDAMQAMQSDPRAARRELARQWSRSPQVARAVVNRLWNHCFGFGFTRTADDMGPGAGVHHARLLQLLAEQFAAHRYDVRRLTRWLVSSAAFGRSSRQIEGNMRDVPERGTTPFFSRYYSRPLAPEAVYQSLALALQPRAIDQEDLIDGRRQWIGRLTRSQDNDEGGELSLFDGGVQQSLQMMNGPLIRRVTSAAEAGFLQQLSQSSLPDRQKVEHLFLTAMARQPSGKELKAALALIDRQRDRPAAALEDIWWALLNSNEFLLDH